MMVARANEEVTYPGLVLRGMDFTNCALELLQTNEGIGKVVYFIAVCPVSPIKQFWQLQFWQRYYILNVIFITFQRIRVFNVIFIMLLMVPYSQEAAM